LLRQPIGRHWTIGLVAASIAALVVLYTVVSMIQHARNPKDTTIPSWGQLAQGVARAVTVDERSHERWIAVDAWATGSRLFLGLFFGIAGAVVLGLLMGCHKGVEAFFAPPLSFLAKIPPTAALAVFFVMVGTDTEMYVAMIAFGILPTLAQAVYLGVRDVPDELLYKAYTLGASNGEIVWNVIFRHMLPKIIDAIRLQIGPAMVYLIAAEMVCGDVGFGYRIRLQSRLLNMSVVYPYLAFLAGFGFAMDHGARRLRRALCPWYAG
jgi:NitT/TauT family transport system permease protein